MDEETVEVVAETGAGVAWCRHCGQPNVESATGDWLCTSCEHYQDSMICPMCNQPARISMMPPDLAPSPHKLARKPKES